jgi:tetratricopeptide (TPR) repeat protein
LEAVGAVCNPDGELDIDTLDGIGSLVSQSLLRRVDGLDGEPRFVLLETLQEYARERLTERGEHELLARRHAEYFASLAERGAAALTGPEQSVWLARLDDEHDNLRAALRWASGHGAGELALRLAGALWPFWEARGYLSEGRRWLAGALALPGERRSTLRGRALRGAGLLATWQGDYATAKALHLESLDLYRALDDRSGVANALENLGLVATEQGDYAAAQTLHTESLGIRQALGNEWDIAGSLSNLGLVARDQGDYPTAQALYAESLALLRAAGYDQGAANALSNLGVIAQRQGQYTDASSLHEESLALRRALGDQRGIAISLISLGLVAFARGDNADAWLRYRESLAITWALRDVELAASLEGLASVAAERGEPLRAARWLGAAGALRATLARPLAPVERADLERWVDRARGAVELLDWDAAEAVGRKQPLESIVQEALATDA